MSGILVIESDRKRRHLLKTLLRDHAQEEITMVDSVEAAIAGFETYQPDLIVAPTLLPCEDSDKLCSHVKQHAEPHVQMLSVPALDMLCEPPVVEDRDGYGFFWRRRRAAPGLQYDPAIVRREITENLLRARKMRSQWPADCDRRRPRTGHDDEFRPLMPLASGARPNERRLDHRIPQRFPWFWTVQFPGGASAELVNISCRGILIESRSLVSPGVALNLRLDGAGVSCIATARFVRSEVARRDRSGVTYHSAAHFDKPLEVPGLRTEVMFHRQPVLS